MNQSNFIDIFDSFVYIFPFEEKNNSDIFFWFSGFSLCRLGISNSNYFLKVIHIIENVEILYAKKSYFSC